MSKLEQVWSHWFWEIGSGDGIRCQGALKGQDGQNIALEGWQALSSVCDLYVELTGAVRSATIHPMRCSRGSDRLASRDTRPLQFLLVKHTLSSAIESPIATVYWSRMRLSQVRSTKCPRSSSHTDASLWPEQACWRVTSELRGIHMFGTFRL